jgi:hypothetical protein
MAGHIAADRILKIAEGTEYLTQEEVEHVEDCTDCVNAIAELVRKRITQAQAG